MVFSPVPQLILSSLFYDFNLLFNFQVRLFHIVILQFDILSLRQSNLDRAVFYMNLSEYRVSFDVVRITNFSYPKISSNLLVLLSVNTIPLPGDILLQKPPLTGNSLPKDCQLQYFVSSPRGTLPPRNLRTPYPRDVSYIIISSIPETPSQWKPLPSVSPARILFQISFLGYTLRNPL